MEITLETPADAQTIDERFNGFHDGFVASIEVRSHDSFVAEADTLGQQLSGRFDLTLIVAHYNYGGAIQPLRRRIRIDCQDARAIRLDLSDVSPESWPLQSIDFVPLQVPDAGPARFALEVTRSRLDGREWRTERERWCTFARATLEEFDAS